MPPPSETENGRLCSKDHVDERTSQLSGDTEMSFAPPAYDASHTEMSYAPPPYEDKDEVDHDIRPKIPDEGRIGSCMGFFIYELLVPTWIVTWLWMVYEVSLEAGRCNP